MNPVGKAITRRGFLQAASTAGAVHVIGSRLDALALAPTRRPRAAWITGENGVHCMRPAGAGWVRTAFHECGQPSAIALHAGTRSLYVAHRTGSFGHKPTGSVSCYRVEQAGNNVSLVHRQALSLACTRPDAVAVSPLGDVLAVASAEAGILNLLPLSEAGVPASVTMVHKELRWKDSFETALNLSVFQMRFVDTETLLVQLQDQFYAYRCEADCIRAIDQENVRTIAGTKSHYPPPHGLQEAAFGLMHNDGLVRMTWL